MKKSVIMMILAMLILAFSSVSFAQDNGEPTTYDFEDDLVSGDLVRPDGEMLRVRKRGRRMTLIRVRQEFVQEMLKSVENL